MKYIYPINSIRLSDEYTIKNIIDEESLIRKVGQSLYLSFDYSKFHNILVVSGKGNNGVDGLALALYLKLNNHKVSIFLTDTITKEIPLKLSHECEDLNIHIYKEKDKL